MFSGLPPKADIDELSLVRDGQQNVNALHGSNKVKRCNDKEVTLSRTPTFNFVRGRSCLHHRLIRPFIRYARPCMR